MLMIVQCQWEINEQLFLYFVELNTSVTDIKNGTKIPYSLNFRIKFLNERLESL